MVHHLVKVLALLSVLGAASCMTAPLHKEETYDILLTDKKTPLDHVSTAIKAGCKDRGWVCTDKKPGEMEASLFNRGHIVRANIIYDTQTLKFVYVSSKNMKEDGFNIHKKYYTWLDNLASSIQDRISKARL